MSWKGTRWSGSARKGTRRQEPGWLTAARSQPPHPRATAAARPRQSGRPTPQPPCRGYDTLRNPPPRSQSCPRAGDRGVSCILAGRMGAGGASEYSRPRLGPGWTRRTVPPTCVGRRCPRPATSTVAAAAGRCGRRAAARLAEDPGGPCWPRRGGGAGHEGRGAVPRGGEGRPVESACVVADPAHDSGGMEARLCLAERTLRPRRSMSESTLIPPAKIPPVVAYERYFHSQSKARTETDPAYSQPDRRFLEGGTRHH